MSEMDTRGEEGGGTTVNRTQISTNTNNTQKQQLKHHHVSAVTSSIHDSVPSFTSSSTSTSSSTMSIIAPALAQMPQHTEIINNDQTTITTIVSSSNTVTDVPASASNSIHTSVPTFNTDNVEMETAAAAASSATAQLLNSTKDSNMHSPPNKDYLPIHGITITGVTPTVMVMPSVPQSHNANISVQSISTISKHTTGNESVDIHNQPSSFHLQHQREPQVSFSLTSIASSPSDGQLNLMHGTMNSASVR